MTASQEQKEPGCPAASCHLSVQCQCAEPAETRLQSHSFHLASAVLHSVISFIGLALPKLSWNTRPHIISTHQM